MKYLLDRIIRYILDNEVLEVLKLIDWYLIK